MLCTLATDIHFLFSFFQSPSTQACYNFFATKCSHHMITMQILPAFRSFLDFFFRPVHPKRNTLYFILHFDHSTLPLFCLPFGQTSKESFCDDRAILFYWYHFFFFVFTRWNARECLPAGVFKAESFMPTTWKVRKRTNKNKIQKA